MDTIKDVSKQLYETLKGDKMPQEVAAAVASTFRNVASSVVSAKGVSVTKDRKDRLIRRLNTELLHAVEAGHESAVNRYLEHGASPNAVCKESLLSASHVAAMTGKTRILQSLLQQGADPGALDSHCRTPLHFAAAGGHEGCLFLLLRTRPELVNLKSNPVPKEDWPEVDIGMQESQDHNHKTLLSKIPSTPAGSTALHVACHFANPDCVSLLLKCGAAVFATDADGLTPFDVVGESLIEETRRVAEVLKILANQGGSPTLTLKGQGHLTRTTALHAAVHVGDEDALCFLSEYAASPEALNRDGETPAHVAVRLQRLDALKNLLLYFADSNVVNAKDAEERTALHCAALAGWLPGVKVLLESGADVSLRLPDATSVLHLAALSGDSLVVLELLNLDEIKMYQLLDQVNKSGATPLVYSLQSGNVQVVEALISAGANADMTMASGLTLLHLAAESGHSSVLGLLLQHTDRALVDRQDVENGMTPLHFAALNGSADCVRVLLSVGCNALLKTKSSHHREATALHLAASRNHHDVICAILDGCMEALDLTNADGFTALHLASKNGNRDSIAVLLQRGANLNAHAKGAKTTPLKELLKNVPRPTELLIETLDNCVSSNGLDVNDPHCVVVANFNILLPYSIGDGPQMRILSQLVDHGQESLLLHPLVQCFLQMKWKKLDLIYFTFFTFFLLFVISFSTLVCLIYYLRDDHDQSAYACRLVVFISLGLYALQEIVQMAQLPKLYLKSFETLLKWACFSLSYIGATATFGRREEEWLRHVNTAAILLAWTELMFLLSKSPFYGYYVLMFYKVANKVFKVLLTFIFLMFGFSLAFMIEFRNGNGFDNPWNALIKTLVLMVGDLDYSGTFDNATVKEQCSNSTVEEQDQPDTFWASRLLFTIFIIFGSIVLMNLLVGLAVSDISDLETQGLQERLKSLVNYICLLELAVDNKLIGRFLRQNFLYKRVKNRMVPNELLIYPGRKEGREIFTAELKDALVSVAVIKQKMKMTDISLEAIYLQLQTAKDENIQLQKQNSEILRHLKEISDVINSRKVIDNS